MRIAIISAMIKEITPIIDKIESLEEFSYENLHIRKGKINNHEIIVTDSGIGKVNAAICLTILNNLFPNIDLIINVGISGGVKGNCERGDIIISEKLSYSDVDTTVFGDSYGQIPDMPLYYYGDKKIVDKIRNKGKCGLILTGDSFVSHTNTVFEAMKHFPNENILCMDMESTAFAQTAYLLKIPYVSIRCISDLIGDDNQIDKYKIYSLIACKKAIDAVLFLLES